MRLFLMILAGVLFLNKFSNAQISEGGKPLEILELKSTEFPLVDLPKIDNQVLLKQSVAELDGALRLKPFRFAEAINVNLSTSNSGIWTTAIDGSQVWILKIRSEGAFSLNLIFDEFKLPEDARLFIYNKNQKTVLGAFTSMYNKESGKFATLPVAGDEITVQYEIPGNEQQGHDFEIIRVNHDFAGILKDNERRPFYPTIAGSCNVDVNCDLGEKWADLRDAVCRMYVDGRELCSGTLINNVAQDQKPYIISAAHCYDNWDDALTTVYSFNYESPYCAPLDGDPSNAISGAVMKAHFDSLDFALAELDFVPPPQFRPYYVGWNNSGLMSDTSVTIHHPWGDIKKISIDYEKPTFSDFNSHYVKNAFLKIAYWDIGVTESGSSGGGLFNNEKLLIGTLTGGVATCSNPVRDYFERFDMAWDYRSETTKQLKCWLDPENTGTSVLRGRRFYENEDLCGAFTNLVDTDSHQLVSLTSNDTIAGYWGGSNSVGITEFMEKFSMDGSELLQGISLGVGKLDVDNLASEITVKVYNGGSLPQTLIYSENYKLNQMAENAMNYLGFSQSVQPGESFFIGFELSNLSSKDSFAVYQALRASDQENTFFYKKGNLWYNYKIANPANSMVNVFELVACNISDDGTATDSQLVDNPLEIMVYPNPANSAFFLEAGTEISIENISVFDILGRAVKVNFSNLLARKVQIDLSGNVPGVYFVRFNNGKNFVTQKVSYVPW